MSEPPLQYPGAALRTWSQQEEVFFSEEELHSLVRIADTLFFASLGKEEGEVTRVRVAYHEQGIRGLQEIQEHVLVGGAHGRRRAWEVIPFEPESTITDFSVKALVKLAPAANLPRTSIVVGPHDGQLRILGLARRVEYTGFYKVEGEDSVFILHAPEPGHLTLSINGIEEFRYEHGSLVPPTHRVYLHDLLFKTESVVRSALMSICKSLVDSNDKPRFLWFTDKEWYISSVVLGLVKQMGTMRHGGLIAILPDSSDIEHARNMGKYRLPPEDGTLLRSRLQEFAASRTGVEELFWSSTRKNASKTEDDSLDEAIDRQFEENDEEELNSLVESIGQLTAVDNALLLGPNLEVVCAGYPIPTQEKEPRVQGEAAQAEKLVVHEAESLKGEPSALYAIEQHGSRHRAAAVFANRYQGGLVFVSSQDGPLRCLHRPRGRNEVLLWNVRLSDE